MFTGRIFCTAEIRQLSKLIVRRNMINGKIYPERGEPERFASEWIMNSSDVNKEELCLYIPVFEFSSVTHWFYKPWLSMRNPSLFSPPVLILTFPLKPLTLPQLLIHPTQPRAHPWSLLWAHLHSPVEPVSATTSCRTPGHRAEPWHNQPSLELRNSQNLAFLCSPLPWWARRASKSPCAEMQPWCGDVTLQWQSDQTHRYSSSNPCGAAWPWQLLTTK